MWNCENVRVWMCESASETCRWFLGPIFSSVQRCWIYQIVQRFLVHTILTFNRPDQANGWMDEQRCSKTSSPAQNFNIFLGCIIDEGTDYAGYDIPLGQKTTVNQQECARFSASTAGAPFWTWNKRNQRCMLKSSNSRKRKLGHAVSGSRECGI